MRGVFTAGVLDAFMKHEIYFRHVVAVSAGAGNGLSYMSRQPRRAHVCNIDLLTKYDYIGLRHLFTQGCIFDPHLLYERFPYELIPYDYDAYYRYARRGFTFEPHGPRRLPHRDLGRPSPPQPSRPGLGQPPLRGPHHLYRRHAHARRRHHRQHPRGAIHRIGPRLQRRRLHARKGLAQHGARPPAFVYRNYPRLRVALSHRIAAYNDQLDMVDRMEAEGRIVVIRPEQPVVVGRMERDVVKLEALYEEGYRLGDAFCRQRL